MAENIIALAIDGLRDKGKADAQAVAVLAVAQEVDGTYLLDHQEIIPTWRRRAYNTEETPVGKPYKWNGQVYKLWQQHDASQMPDWTPDQAVSLWDICHTKNPARATAYVAPQGSRGLWQTDECCTQNGHVWKNLTTNNAYSPAELPARWEDLGEITAVQA